MRIIFFSGKNVRTHVNNNKKIRNDKVRASRNVVFSDWMTVTTGIPHIPFTIEPITSLWMEKNLTLLQKYHCKVLNKRTQAQKPKADG